MNRQLSIIAFVAVLLTGCVTTTVNVVDRKPVDRPFSRVLCFYLPEGCDFSLFDSTLYNICLRNHALQDEGYAQRSGQESIIAKKMSTAGTSVLESSYVLDSTRSSYADFLHYIDSMKVDGLLIVGVRSFAHEDHTGLVPVGGGILAQHTYTTLNGAFMCDLFSTRSLVRPVFRAEIGEKGRRYSTKTGLTAKLLQQVVESLKNTAYIAH